MERAEQETIKRIDDGVLLGHYTDDYCGWVLRIEKVGNVPGSTRRLPADELPTNATACGS